MKCKIGFCSDECTGNGHFCDNHWLQWMNSKESIRTSGIIFVADMLQKDENTIFNLTYADFIHRIETEERNWR